MTKCPEKDCGERIEASVGEIWLNREDDGTWRVFGIGEDRRTYCANDHAVELDEADTEALDDFVLSLEKQLDALVPADD